MGIAPEEQARRAEDAVRIRHSTRMEGGQTPLETIADQEEFVRGEIDEAEMVRRFRSRHHLDG